MRDGPVWLSGCCTPLLLAVPYEQLVRALPSCLPSFWGFWWVLRTAVDTQTWWRRKLRVLASRPVDSLLLVQCAEHTAGFVTICS
jgi:hypothetical protein